MDIDKLEKIFRKKLSPYQDIFGFTCFFGSLNLKNDLDFFIIPKGGIKKGLFMKILIEFLEEIRKELKKQNISLLVAYHSTYEEEVEFIHKKSNSEIVLHVSSFPDIHPVPIKSLLPFLKNAKRVLLGNYKEVTKMKISKIDYYYRYLFISNCLLSKYPSSLERKKVFNKVNHVYKFVFGTKKRLVGSPKKVFFDCCDFLDSQID